MRCEHIGVLCIRLLGDLAVRHSHLQVSGFSVMSNTACLDLLASHASLGHFFMTWFVTCHITCLCVFVLAVCLLFIGSLHSSSFRFFFASGASESTVINLYHTASRCPKISVPSKPTSIRPETVPTSRSKGGESVRLVGWFFPPSLSSVVYCRTCDPLPLWVSHTTFGFRPVQQQSPNQVQHIKSCFCDGATREWINT